VPAFAELIPFTTGDFYSRLLPNPEKRAPGRMGHRYRHLVSGLVWFQQWQVGIEPLFDGRHFGLNSMDYGGYNNPVVNTMIDRAKCSRQQPTPSASEPRPSNA
jgi:peptide/nickel transport system substrate-binding protein